MTDRMIFVSDHRVPLLRYLAGAGSGRLVFPAETAVQTGILSEYVRREFSRFVTAGILIETDVPEDHSRRRYFRVVDAEAIRLFVDGYDAMLERLADGDELAA